MVGIENGEIQIETIGDHEEDVVQNMWNDSSYDTFDGFKLNQYFGLLN